MMSVIAAFLSELRRIFTLKPAVSVLIMGPLIYALFYPQPYRGEALRDVPISVVDLDGTETSRDFIRRIDASSDVAVVSRLPDFYGGERQVMLRQVFGVLVIPKYFERDLLHGRAAPIAVYADASYFLIYQRISQAVSAVAKIVGADVETSRLIAAGIDPAIASAASDPLPLTAVPLFNPQGGYATYLLPAAFALILQQTLLIGVGLLGTIGGVSRPPERDGAVASIIGKLFAYLALELGLVVPFYLIVLPHLYGIPRLGDVSTIYAFAVPFVLSVAAMGMLIAQLFRHPLVVQLVMAAVGMPFLFLSGFSWPPEAIPQFLRAIAVVVPSTSAITGIVAVSQLGATLTDVRSSYLTLWALTGIYVGLAIVLRLKNSRTKSEGS
ncbi:ABC transporter permease [Rhizobium sp.]|uniref:ABC transporter permease n=1 Tax=Rhizobium sp. TaxID=391 RepID=UPI002899E0BD